MYGRQECLPHRGQPLIEYQGDIGRLAMLKEWTVPDSRSLFVGAHLGGFMIESWTIAPLDEEGQPVLKRQ